MFRIAVIGVLCVSLPLDARVFAPFTKRYQVPTKYFDIIFSDASRETALSLAVSADAVYDDLKTTFPTADTGRITLVISGDMETANGYETLLPAATIVLYDFPMQPTFNYSNYMRTLFTHELTHAMAMNIRSPFFSVLSKIFGQWVSISAAASTYMVEGVAVNMESMHGTGRANHPSVHAMVTEDILEGRFKTTAQSSGSYDLFPGGYIQYYYGGLFNRYIYLHYGASNFSALWEVMGGSLFGADDALRQVNGISLEHAWHDFYELMKPVGVTVSNGSVLTPLSYIPCARAFGDRIYFYDGLGRAIKYLDSAGKVSSVLDITGVQSFAISSDGALMLIDREQFREGLTRRETVIYDLNARAFREHVVRGRIGECSFARDGFIGIRYRRYMTDIVRIDTNGTMVVLLAGTSDRYYAQPQMLTPTTMVFLVSEAGKQVVWRFDMTSGALMEYVIPAAYPQSITAVDGKILVTYNNDCTLNRAGIIDGMTMSVMAERPLGGITEPMLMGGKLYGVAQFSKGDAIVRYELPMVQSPVTFRTVISKKNIDDTSVSVTNIIEHSPLAYLLPRMWLPYARTYLDVTHTNIIAEPGFLLYLIDPAEENTGFITVTYNYIRRFANIDVQWRNDATPMRIDMGLYDTTADLAEYADHRVTGAYCGVSYRLDAGNDGAFFRFGITAQHSFIAPQEQGNIYQWPYQRQTTSFGVNTGYSSVIKKDSGVKNRFYEARGFETYHYADYSLRYNAFKYEAMFRYFIPFMPASLSVYGAISDHDAFTPGALPFYFSSLHYPVYNEYRSYAAASRYYSAAECSGLVWNVEMQNGIDLLPLYFNRWYGTAGYRAAYTGGNYLHSVFVRTWLDITSWLPVTMYIEGQYAITSHSFGYAYHFVLPFDF
ncbi:MAG: hypothetical protein HZC28_09265 [Spirochaetes bacterium]|nr:hypothetical protein [Spirochaetota bacterium]